MQVPFTPLAAAPLPPLAAARRRRRVGRRSSRRVRKSTAPARRSRPIYSKWFSEYSKLKPGVAINYQSIGSGGGIRQLTNQTVFFGATDGPMTTEQMQAAPGKILHLPTVLGAVVPIYNVPGRQGRAEVQRARCSPTSSWARSRSGTTRRSPS